MYAARETWYDKVHREANEKAYAIAEAKVYAKAKAEANQEKVNMILNMMKENLSDEIIARCCDFTLEQIAKIKEEKTITKNSMPILL